MLEFIMLVIIIVNESSSVALLEMAIAYSKSGGIVPNFIIQLVSSL